MGQACNDVALVLAIALTEHSRALHRSMRLEQHSDTPANIEARTATKLFHIATTHVRQLTDLYTATVAPYVAYAVETASRAIKGQPPHPARHHHRRRE